MSDAQNTNRTEHSMDNATTTAHIERPGGELQETTLNMDWRGQWRDDMMFPMYKGDSDRDLAIDVDGTTCDRYYYIESKFAIGGGTLIPRLA